MLRIIQFYENSSALFKCYSLIGVKAVIKKISQVRHQQINSSPGIVLNKIPQVNFSSGIVLNKNPAGKF